MKIKCYKVVFEEILVLFHLRIRLLISRILYDSSIAEIAQNVILCGEEIFVCALHHSRKQMYVGNRPQYNCFIQLE